MLPLLCGTKTAGGNARDPAMGGGMGGAEKCGVGRRGAKLGPGR
jgi:hypothetical protein